MTWRGVSARRSKRTDAAAQVPARAPTPPSSSIEQNRENVLPVPKSEDETAGQAIARVVLRPTVTAAITLKNISSERDSVSLGDLIGELTNQCGAVAANRLGRAEDMLIAQAHTLDALFHRLVRRAAQNEGANLSAVESYYRLALRAQGQCRATLETLALCKNPPHLAFVKQANIGQAVQDNNGESPPELPSPRARETENEPNKLLEHSNGQRLDSGAPATASEVDSSLEAVGAVHRPADSAG